MDLCGKTMSEHGKENLQFSILVLLFTRWVILLHCLLDLNRYSEEMSDVHKLVVQANVKS